MANRIPARIHVLMARDAPTGVVIRRGPSTAVCTIGWDRRKDVFQVGQWMRGRIYERRADVSPDGKYMIYFAMNGRWHSDGRGSWTAVSRAPYLKAVALYPKGDCWNGGGLFTSRETYWLNSGYGHDVAYESHEAVPDWGFVPTGGVGNECLGVYFPRLLRDGWTLLGREDTTFWTFEELAQTTEPGAAGKARVSGALEGRAGPVWAFEELAQTTEPGAAGKARVSGALEGRAGPVWAPKELAQTTEPGAADQARVSGALAGRAGPVWAFEKDLANGWSLRKIANSGIERGAGKGCYWDEHELVHHRREIVIPCRNWEWADVDGSRIVWAEAGVLNAGRVSASGLTDARVLIDLNPMKFEPIAAPY